MQVKTEKLWISSTIQRNTDAEEMLREFADKAGITGKDYLHLGLLAEETMGMAHRMMQDFEGEIWAETGSGGYQIILEAEVRQNGAHPRQNPEGFMGKIAEMLNCAYMFEEKDDVPEELASVLPDYMSYGAPVNSNAAVWAGKWSLSDYRKTCLRRKTADHAAEVALDELEKSIVASIAKEVTVGIEGSKVRLVITG